jgi:hypothetical protein
VIAETFCVAVSGALFGVTVHLTDRRVQIDHHVGVAGTSTRGPRVRQQSGSNGVELADEPERERSQERPDRRWCHHLERQHRLGRTGTQHVDMINVGRTGDHRCDQCAEFAARSERPGPYPLIRQAFQTEARHQRGDHDQPGIGDQTIMIEGRFIAVDAARYWEHRKCLLLLGWLVTSTSQSSQRRRPFWWTRTI